MSIVDAVGWFGLCCALPVIAAAMVLLRVAQFEERAQITQADEQRAREGVTP